MQLLDKRVFSISLLMFTVFSATSAHADSGWYLGGSVGQASIELDVPGAGDSAFGFDERERAWKMYGGYVVDLPLVDVGVEGGYVEFGSPSEQFPAFRAEADVSGFNLWGVAGVDVGPVGVFGKLGAIAWELDGQNVSFVDRSFNESGTDIGFGVGAKFMLFSLEVRAEYERYQIDDGVDMISVGVNWVF